jgi:hypothetical protein
VERLLIAVLHNQRQNAFAFTRGLRIVVLSQKPEAPRPIVVHETTEFFFERSRYHAQWYFMHPVPVLASRSAHVPDTASRWTSRSERVGKAA